MDAYTKYCIRLFALTFAQMSMENEAKKLSYLFRGRYSDGYRGRGTISMKGWWISLEEAKEISIGGETWWTKPGYKGRVVEVRQYVHRAPPDRPIWLFENGDMYLGPWKTSETTGKIVECGYGSTYFYYYFDGVHYPGAVYTGEKREGLCDGMGRLWWIDSSPTWINNFFPGSPLQEWVANEDSGFVGRPLTYEGFFQNGNLHDNTALVSVKDGTTRVGPWRDNLPVGDWWKDHKKIAINSGTVADAAMTLANFSGTVSEGDCKRLLNQCLEQLHAGSPTLKEKNVGRLEGPKKRRKIRGDDFVLKSDKKPDSVLSTPKQRLNSDFATKLAGNARAQDDTKYGRPEDGNMEGAQKKKSATEQNPVVVTPSKNIGHIGATFKGFWDGYKNTISISGTNSSLKIGKKTSLFSSANKNEASGPPTASVQVPSRSKISTIQSTSTGAQGRTKKTQKTSKDIARAKKISAWLANIIGFDPDMKDMKSYADKFIHLGLHSAEMIEAMCTQEFLNTNCLWMKPFHRIQVGKKLVPK